MRQILLSPTSSAMPPSSLPTQQYAAVLHSAKDLRLEQRPLWHPQTGYVQVEVKSTGLCGSDRMYLHFI